MGVGTATAVYSLIYGILLRPYPYADPDRLVRVQSRHVKQGDVLQGCSLFDIEDIRRRATTIGDIGAYTAFGNRVITDAGGEPAVKAGNRGGGLLPGDQAAPGITNVQPPIPERNVL